MYLPSLLDYAIVTSLNDIIKFKRVIYLSQFAMITMFVFIRMPFPNSGPKLIERMCS